MDADTKQYALIASGEPREWISSIKLLANNSYAVSSNTELLNKLRELDATGKFDAVVIDEGSFFGSAVVARTVVLQWAMMPRPVWDPRACPACSNMRVIYVCGDDVDIRGARWVSELFHVGVLDIIAPKDAKSAEVARRCLAARMLIPARYSDVAAYDMGCVPRFFAPGIAQEDKDAARATSLRMGSRTIAVAGMSRKVGTTTAALTLGRSFVLSGMDTGIVFPEKWDYDNIVQTVATSLDLAGYLSIGSATAHEAIDIFCAKEAGACPKHEHIYIIDLGDLFSSTYPEEAKAAATRTWRNADIRVLVVQTGFTQLREFSELLEGADRHELNHLSLFCNLSSDEMVSMIEVGVHDTSPSMGVFRMPEVGDPLALDEIPLFVKKWFVHATGGDELKETRQISVADNMGETDELAECAGESTPQKPGFFAKLLGKGAGQ